MKNNLVVKIFVLLSIVILLSSCRSGRPDLAKDMEGKGAVQDIEIFNVTKSAENFRETKDKFKDEVEEIRDLENIKKIDTRRVSLSPNKNKNKTSLSIVDHNQFVKKLETQDVSLKFNDMDIKSALKLFASLAQRNIIIGDEVTGNVTVDFENLNWGSAVYAILDINDLVMTVDDNSDLLRVHSKEVYVEMEKAKISRTLEVNKNVMTLEGGGSGDLDEEGNVNRLVITEIFKVFHQESASVIEPMQAILGEDTLVEFIDDVENNQLLVKGTPQELNYVEDILNQIDIEKKQVLIEAYIINASDTFSENFQNNLTAYNARLIKDGKTGISFTGLNTDPGLTEIQSGDITNSNADTSAGIFENTTVEDFNGAVLLANIGFTRLKSVINMSITNNNGETISNPKLFAMDGETATLTQGTTLFVKLSAADGAGEAIEQVPQNLTITVTPEVIGSSKVKLELDLNNDKPITGGDEIASNTEAIQSNILLNSDEVAVLGGVYVNTKTDNTTSTPLFSKIPIIGTFFKSDTISDNRTQLLIFISASIV